MILWNGIVNGLGYVEGLLYRFFCNDGYFIVGYDVLYCNEMGYWNVSFFICLRGNKNNNSSR